MTILENNDNDDDDELIDALKFESATLICPDTHNIPVKWGNCFSVHASDGKVYNIVNFIYENLKFLIEDYEIDFPFKIYALNARTAILHDYRIPDVWYRAGWCEVCCPTNLLPIEQRLRHKLDIQRGNRTEHNGFITIKMSDRYELKKKSHNSNEESNKNISNK